jgi:hypothetical protein
MQQMTRWPVGWSHGWKSLAAIVGKPVHWLAELTRLQG